MRKDYECKVKGQAARISETRPDWGRLKRVIAGPMGKGNREVVDQLTLRESSRSIDGLFGKHSILGIALWESAVVAAH